MENQKLLYLLVMLLAILKSTFCGKHLAIAALSPEIQNENFSPKVYEGPREYSIDDIEHWFVKERVFITVKQSAMVYISDWKAEKHEIPGKDTTLLRMSFDRKADYWQEVSGAAGDYLLTALIISLAQQTTLTLVVSVGAQKFYTQIRPEMQEPEEMVIAKYCLQHEFQALKIQIHETDHFSKAQKKFGLLISNVKISKAHLKGGSFFKSIF